MTATKGRSFHELPPEVVEKVVENLDLETIKNLRLANRVCRILCIGPHFKKFFRQRTTDLTESSLRALCALSSHPDLGPAVRHLTIMAVVYDPSEIENIMSMGTQQMVGRPNQGTVEGAIHATLARENNLIFDSQRDFKGPRPIIAVSRQKCKQETRLAAESDLAWLRARQKEQDEQSDESIISYLVSAFNFFGRLVSVNLDAITVWGRHNEVSTLHGKDWHPIWVRASQVYRQSMSALAKSGIMVHSLAVYRNTLRCSVPSCDIMTSMEKLDSRDVARLGESIQHLALSVSMKVETDASEILAARKHIEQANPNSRMKFGWDMLAATDPKAVAEINFNGIARLLKYMPNLVAIDLHLYRCLKGNSNAYDNVFELISQHNRLPSLKQCYLRGIYSTQGSLLRFLTNHPNINHLDFREIRLTCGSWGPIIDHLNSKMPALTHLRLSNLWAMQILNLLPVWEDDFDEMDYLGPNPTSYPSHDGLVVHTRSFNEHDLRKGLKFQATAPNNIPLGSPGTMHWNIHRLSEYGPPTQYG